MKKLLIIGASGHGKVIANMASDSKLWDEISFLDDYKVGQEVLGFNVMDSSINAIQYIEEYDFIVGIGDADIREEITKRLKEIGATIATVVHPSAIVGLDVSIGQGTVIMPNCVINPPVYIGEGCIVNTGASIDHDCVIADYVHLSPGVVLGGAVHIGYSTWLGVGVVAINNINISSNCVIGAGAVVIHSLSQEGKYIGVPAKIIENKEVLYEKCLDTKSLCNEHVR